MKLLILGGTAEAARLAALATSEPGLEVTTSLAGRTRAPAALPGAVRVGGFGGADALARYLVESGVDRLVDATHPFARTMPHRAAAAAAATGTPRVRLLRPPWPAEPGDRWIEVADIAAAAAALPADAHVFLTVGRQELAPFAARADCRFLVRSIEPPEALPAHAAWIGARGPFAETRERRLLEEHGIEMIVAKNAGGAATYGKIAAARALGLPVVMVARPPQPAGPTVETAEAALAWALEEKGDR